jgi:hypothetical protein
MKAGKRRSASWSTLYGLGGDYQTGNWGKSVNNSNAVIRAIEV